MAGRYDLVVLASALAAAALAATAAAFRHDSTALMLGGIGCGWFIAAGYRPKPRPAGEQRRVCGYDLRATPDRCPECGTSVGGSRSA